MPLVLKTLKTFFLAKTRNRYYCIHTSIPPCPHAPRRKHGLRAAPPPPPWDPPPGRAANTPPPVLTDNWRVGRIRTDCSCPPVGCAQGLANTDGE